MSNNKEWMERVTVLAVWPQAWPSQGWRWLQTLSSVAAHSDESLNVMYQDRIFFSVCQYICSILVKIQNKKLKLKSVELLHFESLKVVLIWSEMLYCRNQTKTLKRSILELENNFLHHWPDFLPTCCLQGVFVTKKVALHIPAKLQLCN